MPGVVQVERTPGRLLHLDQGLQPNEPHLDAGRHFGDQRLAKLRLVVEQLGSYDNVPGRLSGPLHRRPDSRHRLPPLYDTRGIEPDIVVEPTSDYCVGVGDPALEAALRMLGEP